MDAREPSARLTADDDGLLAAIVHSSDDAVISKDLFGNITSWNGAAHRIYGYAAEEVVGKPISLLSDRDHPDEMVNILERIRAGERVAHYETVRVRKNGTTCAVSLTISPILGVNGAITGVSTIARDVSERQRLEKRFEGFLETAPDAVVVVGQDGLITLVNAQTERLFGYTRHQVLGKSVEMLVPERFRGNHPAYRGEYFRTPTARVRDMGAGAELFGLHRDGTEFPVEISLTPLETPHGFLVATTIRDVTLQKQSSQYVRSLIEASLDPLVTISPEGKITDVNAATVDVTGVVREKLIGTDFSDYFTEPDKAGVGYKRVFEQGFVTDYPLTIRHTDGKLTNVLYNASVYKDVSGKVLGVFAAARDVTSQRQAEDNLRKASQYARSLIEASLDPLVTISPEGKITDVNAGSVKVTGVLRENLIGTDFSNYFTEPEKAREGYQQVFANGFVTDYPLTIRHEDGRLTDVLYNASVYKDVQGNVLGVFAAARDVTDQKQASQYARSLIEASLDPLVTISPEGKITDVNAGSIKVTGMLREDLIGTDFSNYFTEPEKAREGYQQVFANGFVTDYPLTIRHENGRLTDVLYNASVYKDVQGNVLGVFAAARDVTARVQAEQALLKAGALQNAIFNSANFSSIATDAKGVIQIFNVGAERMLGYAAAEVTNKITPADISDPHEVIARAKALSVELGTSITPGFEALVFKASRGIEDIYELTYFRKDGSRFPAVVSVTALRDGQDAIIGYLLIGTDNTARKKAEAEVADQRTKELDRLAELERFQRLTIGRELKMIELKREILELKRLIPAEPT